MNGSPESFTVATDERVAQFVRDARTRLVIVAPAIPEAVADAVVDRIGALGPDAVTLILDSDSESYRLGYGTFAAFERVAAAAASSGLAIRRQPGIRIALVVSDMGTLIFTPTARLIEAGPNTSGGANAILLSSAPKSVEEELGLLEGPARLGRSLMGTADVARVRQDLAQNPPQKFDVARKLRVFNAYLEFVELEVKGTEVARHLVTIPSHLMAVIPERTRRNLRTSCRLVGQADQVSAEAISNERRLLTRRYIRVIPGYGAAILRTDREAFDKAVASLQASVAAFAAQVQAKLQDQIDRSIRELEKSLLPALKRRPPEVWGRLAGGPPDEAMIKENLAFELLDAFGTAAKLTGQMSVVCRFKGVTYELLTDPEFIERATKVFPQLPGLHEEHDAAKAQQHEPSHAR
ncbi:MAG: hypothetical protein Q8O42_02660 [Acidobacteriota bacterium]|nr:hypothetical protein [Acidobacteriota bacterium]